MKINYPIKYAAMPIIEQVGWTMGWHELEREYDTVCYIVSKCYLINELTKYKENGKMVKGYEVVFPYQPGEFNRWQRTIPTYNSIHGYCTKETNVDTVFDSYEDALNFVNAKNEELCKKTYLYMPYSENYAAKIQAKKDEFASKLNEYKLLEQQILLQTEDMQIGNNKDLNNVIKINDNSAKVLSSNLYEALPFFTNDKFVVYNITQEQYNTLVKLINENNIDNITSLVGSQQGLILHEEKDGLIKIAINNGEDGVYYVQNNQIKYDYKLDKVTQESFNKIDEDTLKFYTTETIDDLLYSYKRYPEIDLADVQTPVLKKVKK